MFDRLSIRTKLIAMVAAPLAVVVGFAGLGFAQRQSEAATTRADATRLEAIVAVQQLQAELQLESLYSVAFLADPEASGDRLAEQRDTVDAASAEVADALEAVGGDAVESGTGRAALRGIGQLDSGLRSQIDRRDIEWAWSEQLYQTILGYLPSLGAGLAGDVEDGSVARGAAGVVALGDYTATQGRIGTLLAGAAADGEFPLVSGGAEGEDEPASSDREITAAEAVTYSAFIEATDRAMTQLAIVNAQAGTDVRVRLRSEMVGDDLNYFTQTLELARSLGPTDPVDVDLERWVAASEATLAQLREIADGEAGAVLDDAASRVSEADRAARLFMVGALLAVVGALALAVLVAASIVRPIVALTAAADRVASVQLPKLVDALRNPDEEDVDHLRPSMETLESTGGKELARLTESVDKIQQTAVSVATEQADLLRKGIGDMFINLARRNQGLLDRQLEYIDDLEAQEEDPEQLEHLFKLDHMATRMRRNAESLLVLAGAEPGRRRGKPIPLSKVALAAVGEIEHFDRVDLIDVDECEVTSSAAADLAHLLSELLENATQFSPPDSRVEVVGHRSNGGSYTLSVTDQGIGMSADQVAEANALLARPPILGLTLARTLGFIVVGRLAARHSIAVRLVASPGGGVTAIVNLPEPLLVATADRLDLSDTAARSGRLGATPPRSEPIGLAPFDSPSGGPTPADAAPPKSTGAVDTPSSILPPFEFYSAPLDGADIDEQDAPTDPSTEPVGASTVPDDPPPADPVPPANPLFGPLPEQPAPAAPPVESPRLFGAPRSTAGPTSGGTHLFRAPPVEVPVPSGPEPVLPSTDVDRRSPATDGSPLSVVPERTGRAAAPAAPGPELLPPTADRSTAPPTVTSAPPEAAPPSETPSPSAPVERVADGPELTSAGLVKRVPRRAGAKRAIPGSDGSSRPTSSSTRSPEEVRAMLSRFHSGKKAGIGAPSSDASLTTTPSEPKEH